MRYQIVYLCFTLVSEEISKLPKGATGPYHDALQQARASLQELLNFC